MIGCSIWTHKENRGSRNGVFYGWTSQSDCMAACVKSASCVAIDVGPVGCVLHNNIKDLSDTYNASGVTQFLLHRECLSTARRPTARETTVEAENITKSAGKVTEVNTFGCFANFSTVIFFVFNSATTLIHIGDVVCDVRSCSAM